MNDEAPHDSPLRSVHTTNFPNLLEEIQASLLITTYQAGKLVILRNNGGVLNTHFRSFEKPMGLAVSGGKLALGTNVEVWEFHNVPAACRQLDNRSINEATSDELTLLRPKHDACYLPRRVHTTGDVQIHEMAWVGEELWFINTAFSCLCARSDVYSFQPRWLPPFINHLVPSDCCHLNGMAIRDGCPQYVTALGATGAPAGWRGNKRNGGVLIEVASGEILLQGLSMPHSPRWHRDELWLLESGDGTLGRVNLTAARYEPIVQLPGFTRGLTFWGPLAFVGLSQVRESAIFSGFPLVERLEDRICGVWVVNIDTGEVIAFTRFEGEVREIFAVELLVGSSYADVINNDAEFIGRSYVLPDDAIELVPQEFRTDK